MITIPDLPISFTIALSTAILGIVLAYEYLKEIPQQYKKIFYPVLLLCSLITIVFLIYSYKFNAISSSTDGWSAFGSLLAGCFTFLSAGATLATLCFLIFQHEENKVLNDLEKQHKHTTLFIEMLVMNEESASKRFSLPNKLGLYNQIFQYNLPKKIILTPTISEGILQKIIQETVNITNAISRFNNRCSSPPLSDDLTDRRYDCIEFIDSFSNAYKRIQTELFKLHVPQPAEGDIFVADHNICLNIFSPFQDIEKTISLVNNILRFTGNHLFASPSFPKTWEFQCLLYHELVGTPFYNSMYAPKRKRAVALFHVLYLLFDTKEDPQLASIIDQISFNLSTESMLKRLENDDHLRSFLIKQIEQLNTIVEDNPDHVFIERLEQVIHVLRIMLNKEYATTLSIIAPDQNIYPTFID